MSEQADSFHVRCDRTGPVVEWLEKSRALALVLPPRGELITVYVPAHHVGSVIASSHFMMIYYEFLDDERVTARLYDGPREVTFLERTFPGKGTSRFDAKPWITQRFIDRARAKTLERGLGAPWPERSERHWVADVLGLHNVAWGTGEDLMTRRAELVERFPGSILVQAGDPTIDAERRRYPPSRTTPPPSIIVDPIAVAPSTPVPTSPATAPMVAPTPAAPASPPADTTPPISTPTIPPSKPAPIPTTPAVTRAPAPTRTTPTPRLTPQPPAPAPTLAALDELDAESTREQAARRTPPRQQVGSGPSPAVRPNTQPSNRPALIPDLPIIDEFASDPEPAGTRAPSAPMRGLVLCALTKQRQSVLQNDARLIDALLEARFEETIPGLLDLGTRASDLASLLAATDAIDAVRATSARPIPGTTARILDKQQVVRIAALLRTIDVGAVTRTATTYRLAEDLRDLIKLYTEAAQRGNAMLVAHD